MPVPVAVKGSLGIVDVHALAETVKNLSQLGFHCTRVH